ncbi:MAG: hypothetical protein JW807_05690 [Spirochaetes bacterium]|nr:hypothetical protein [Spirochaetota bacterium]
MSHKIGVFLACLFAASILLPAAALYSKEPDFTTVAIKKLNRYDEDRLFYQQYEKSHEEFSDESRDNSFATLMLIKDKKVYLFQDGYDNPELVKYNRFVLEKGNQNIPDMWQNKIDGLPDYVVITNRRIEVQKNTTKEWVSANYKDFYTSVRDKLLRKHVAIFMSLIVNRLDSEINVSRKRIPRKIYEGDEPKFSTSVSARTPDGGTVYYAEDANGDGITETFTAHSSDGFQWGYKSGPNLVCIVNNTQKDIENIIGRLTNFGYYGSADEEQVIKKTFPTNADLNYMINDIYRIDLETEKFLKKNDIDIEQELEKSSKGEGK